MLAVRKNRYVILAKDFEQGVKVYSVTEMQRIKQLPTRRRTSTHSTIEDAEYQYTNAEF